MSIPVSKEKSLFYEALEVADPAKRKLFLDQACAGDAELRSAVEELLTTQVDAEQFFAESTSSMTNLTGELESALAQEEERTELAAEEKPGTVIGRYKLLQKIGEGGGGVVFLAEQTAPVQRRVALKIIKPGMDTKNVIARFEAERQALAMMDHPSIAKIFDAGATQSGRPYFVMELVRGIKITEYCDQHSSTVEERLKLFIRVCQAVQHAHQKGIIHRDIKPSNILVTTSVDGAALPVVIDFGIAKATTHQRLTDKTLFTSLEMLIGTPAYMSPEQAAFTSVDVDTRTDVYSLGVLLYELLTSTTPFDTEALLKSGLDEIRRVIREEDPVRPSTRLSRTISESLTVVAQNRGSEPATLIRVIRGDLDWIVMKALEKDRTRRYETANDLALDVKRLLECEPVSARHPSSLYKFQKSVARNKFLFVGAGVFALLLVTGLVIVSMSLVKEKQARREAELESAKSRQVTQFLENMLQGVGPSVARGRDTTMLREIFDQTDKRISTGLTYQPEVEAEMRNLIGGLYLEIGNYDKAEKSERAAVALDRALGGHESTELATSLHELSMALDKEGRLAEAESAELEALAIRRHVLGEQNSDVSASLNNLASVYTDERRFAEAESLCREALATRKKLFGEYSLPVADSLHAYSVILGGENKNAECEAAAREMLAIREKILGTNDVSVASALYDVAWAADSNGKSAEAESLELDDLKLRRKLLGDLHPNVAASLSFLGQIMGHRGQLTESEVVLSAAYSIQCKLQGEDSPDALYALDAIGMTLNNEDKWNEAEAVYNKSLAAWRKQQGNTGPRALWALKGLATALAGEKKYDQAAVDLSAVLTPAFLKDPACSSILAYRLDLVGRQGRWKEAAADASLLVQYDLTDQYFYHALAAILALNRNRPAYEQLCQTIVAKFTNTSNPYFDERIAKDCLFLTNSGVDLKFVDQLVDRSVAIEKSYGSGYPDAPYFQVAKAMSAYRLGRFSEAIEWAQETIKGSVVYPNAHAYAILAMAHWQLGEKDAARLMLAKGESTLPKISPGHEDVNLGDSWVAWLEAQISLDEAAQLIQPDTVIDGK